MAIKKPKEELSEEAFAEATKNTGSIMQHLEMIQKVVARLGINSFCIKAFSLFVLAGAISMPSESAIYFLVPVLLFWYLDSFYLLEERIFRGLYNAIRKQKGTDYTMNMVDVRKQHKITEVFISKTQLIFYSIQIYLIVLVYVS